MYCATCSMGEYKMNPPLLMPALSLYVGQCIGMDTVRIQIDNVDEGKRGDWRQEEALARILHECCREAFETEARRGFSQVRPT
mgnify:CR=1 FL=1